MLQLAAPYSVPKTISTGQNAPSLVTMVTPSMAQAAKFARKIQLHQRGCGQAMRQNVKVCN